MLRDFLGWLGPLPGQSRRQRGQDRHFRCFQLSKSRRCTHGATMLSPLPVVNAWQSPFPFALTQPRASYVVWLRHESVYRLPSPLAGPPAPRRSDLNL